MAMASMQVELLGQFASTVARRINAQLPLSSPLNGSVRRAVQILGAAYGGTTSPGYRSDSLRRQIDDDVSRRADINAVRSFFGFGDLKP